MLENSARPNSDLSTSVVIATRAQIAAVVSAGYSYFWRLWLTDGREVDQFDDSGAERRVADYCKIMEKGSDDPYPGSFVLLGVVRAAWIPVGDHDRFKAQVADLDGAEGIILYRKWQVSTGSNGSPGSKYCTYVIGRRVWNSTSGVIEACINICPPATYHPDTGLLFTAPMEAGEAFTYAATYLDRTLYHYFGGGVSYTTKANDETLFDKFRRSCDSANT